MENKELTMVEFIEKGSEILKRNDQFESIIIIGKKTSIRIDRIADKEVKSLDTDFKENE